jgi:hypothetical protein
MSHHAIKYMRQAGYGRIINFSSDAFKGSVGQCNYSAAKAGIIGLTRSIAKECAKFGITANAICPAADTRMMMNDAVIASQKRKLDAGLISQDQYDRFFAGRGPEHIAPLIGYLALDQADHGVDDDDWLYLVLRAQHVRTVGEGDHRHADLLLDIIDEGGSPASLVGWRADEVSNKDGRIDADHVARSGSGAFRAAARRASHDSSGGVRRTLSRSEPAIDRRCRPGMTSMTMRPSSTRCTVSSPA